MCESYEVFCIWVQFCFFTTGTILFRSFLVATFYIVSPPFLKTKFTHTKECVSMWLSLAALRDKCTCSGPLNMFVYDNIGQLFVHCLLFSPQHFFQPVFYKYGEYYSTGPGTVLRHRCHLLHRTITASTRYGISFYIFAVAQCGVPTGLEFMIWILLCGS